MAPNFGEHWPAILPIQDLDRIGPNAEPNANSCSEGHAALNYAHRKRMEIEHYRNARSVIRELNTCTWAQTRGDDETPPWQECDTRSACLARTISLHHFRNAVNYFISRLYRPLHHENIPQFSFPCRHVGVPVFNAGPTMGIGNSSEGP